MRFKRPGPPEWIEMEVVEAEPPLADRALAPLTRAIMRRGNERAMRRLAQQLDRGA